MAKFDIVADVGNTFLSMGLTSHDFVLREPSVVAEDAFNKGAYLACGIKAMQMAEDADASIRLVSPIVNGVVVDASALKYLAQNCMQKIMPSGTFVPSVKVYCVVNCSMEDMSKTLIDECFNALGVKKVIFIPSAVADARIAKAQFGCDSCITVNIGSTVTDVCAVDGDKILAGASMFWAGNDLDKLIVNYVKQKHNVKISIGDARAIKQNCCSLYPNNMSTFKVRGVNVEQNQQQTAEVSSRELYDTVCGFFDKILSVINSLYLSVPVSEAEKLRQNGVVLSGGMGGIDGLEKFFFDKLRYPVRLLEEPACAGVVGARLFASDK